MFTSPPASVYINDMFMSIVVIQSNFRLKIFKKYIFYFKKFILILIHRNDLKNTEKNILKQNKIKLS
jgi:hypothetical protein